MSFRRPNMRKISRKVPKPKKSLRRLKPKSVKPSRILKRPPITKLSHNKKKKIMHLGTCFAGTNCTGKILLKRSTKNKCKISGGKSWRRGVVCQKI